MSKMKYSKTGLISGIALLGVITGCASYQDEPHHARRYAPPQTVYVESDPIVQDDYIYYPSYQVYYSSTRRQYIYQEGRSWVARPAPRVSVHELFASPSVTLNFHDSPANHHAMVVRQYPTNWAPPGRSPKHEQGNRDDGEGNNQGGHR
jgi:hypothetical protein